MAVEAILPLRDALRAGWSLQNYKLGRGQHQDREDDGAQHCISLDTVNEAITFTSFWAYASMIALVGSVLQSISGWSEGCPCHDWDPQLHAATYWRRRVARQWLLGKKACPMATRRAPECAAGALFSMAANLFNIAQADFLLRPDILGFCEDTRAVVLRDLEALRRHVRFTASLIMTLQ